MGEESKVAEVDNKFSGKEFIAAFAEVDFDVDVKAMEIQLVGKYRRDLFPCQNPMK